MRVVKKLVSMHLYEVLSFRNYVIEELKVGFLWGYSNKKKFRSFKKDHVPEEVLNRILDAARIAPSGSNRQPWKFIIVKDEALKQKMPSLATTKSS